MLTILILQKIGAISDAGGNFSKKQKAEEDQYFRRQQQEQLVSQTFSSKFHH